MAENVYTRAEAVQVKIGKRWRNATVVGVEAALGGVQVELESGETLTLHRASPELRKWGAGRPSDAKPRVKRRAQRIRYTRSGYTGLPVKP
jgi:hypothetical protein